MQNTVIIIAAAVLLAGLLFFEKNENQKGKLPTKTILSCLFILTALLQPHLFSEYFYILLIGLIFCLGGDVFLALPQQRMFLFGLVSFLLGHVCYVICFFYVADLNPWTWGGGAIGLAISGLVFFWLRPHLGPMLVPVIAYIIVITAMVIWGLHCPRRYQASFDGTIPGNIRCCELLYLGSVCGPGSVFKDGIFQPPSWITPVLYRAIFAGLFRRIY